MTTTNTVAQTRTARAAKTKAVALSLLANLAKQKLAGA